MMLAGSLFNERKRTAVNGEKGGEAGGVNLKRLIGEEILERSEQWSEVHPGDHTGGDTQGLGHET
jgi:hypothetical protein